jgi:hypothetical protein
MTLCGELDLEEAMDTMRDDDPWLLIQDGGHLSNKMWSTVKVVNVERCDSIYELYLLFRQKSWFLWLENSIDVYHRVSTNA